MSSFSKAVFIFSMVVFCAANTLHHDTERVTARKLRGPTYKETIHQIEECEDCEEPDEDKVMRETTAPVATPAPTPFPDPIDDEAPEEPKSSTGAANTAPIVPPPPTFAPSHFPVIVWPTAAPPVPAPAPEEVAIYNGRWGSWKGWKGADTPGMYACGAQVRFEGRQGRGDDTAANGLKLKFCHLGDWEKQVTKSIYDGLWGDWGGMIMCPKNMWITGAKVRFQDHVRGKSNDNSALNGLKIWCSTVEEADESTGNKDWITVEHGIWGEWKSGMDPNGKFVKEANIRFQSSQGKGEDRVSPQPPKRHQRFQRPSDDTAWNGLWFRMETPRSD